MQAAKASGDKDRQTRCNMSQAALKWMQGEYGAAEARYLQALDYWKGKGDTVEVTRCLLNLGTVCQAAKKNAQAVTYLGTALGLAQEASQHLIASQAAGSMATVFFQLGDPDSLKKYSTVAIKGFAALHDSANLARAHANLGFYYRELGMSFEARQPYLDAMEYLEGTEEVGVKGEIHDGFASLEYRVGNFESAIEHFLIARDYFTQLKWHKKIADNNVIIGLCFKTLGREAAAGFHFAEAYRLADSISNPGVAASALSNLATMDREAGRCRQAILRYKDAIVLDQLSPEYNELSVKYLGLGLCSHALGLLDSASYYLDLAFGEARQNGNELQVAEIFMERAKLAIPEQRYRLALDQLDSALHWYSTQHHATGLQQVYHLRSQCHEAMGDFVAALRDARLASQWGDSVQVFSTASQLLTLEAKFWSEKKQHALEIARQNEALTAKEAERAQEASARLAAQRNLLVTALALTVLFAIGLYWINLKRRKTQLHRKLAEMRMAALRAQMNPHFIFNALGSVQLLINTSAIHEANLYLSKFAQLLRNTLDRSGSQDSTLQDEIEALRLYIDLEALRFKFRYVVEVEDAIDAEALHFPTLLLQPIVENAVRHGLSPKPQEGLLSLLFFLEGKELCCVVEDNGVGRSGSKRRSHHAGDRKSYGIQITQERLSLLHPSRADRFKIIDVADVDGKPSGTRVEIRIPIQSI